jgi:hypothetical protein
LRESTRETEDKATDCTEAAKETADNTAQQTPSLRTPRLA